MKVNEKMIVLEIQLSYTLDFKNLSKLISRRKPEVSFRIKNRRFENTQKFLVGMQKLKKKTRQDEE